MSFDHIFVNDCNKLPLTHWGRVTHIGVSKLTIIGSDNGLSPERHQAIIWTNAGILIIGPLGTNFSEILVEILTSSLKKMWLKVSSAKWRPFCLGLNVLRWNIVKYFVKMYTYIMGCVCDPLCPPITDTITWFIRHHPSRVDRAGSRLPDNGRFWRKWIGLISFC